MSEFTGIAWTDATWNPWRGCRKISDGCKHCYAETLVRRFGGDFSKRFRAAPATFNAPLKWNKQGLVCAECGTPIVQRADAYDCECGQAGAIATLRRRRVFSLSLGDWLDEEAPTQWRADMLAVIDDCPNLDFLLLTKRPKAWQARIMECAGVSRLARKWWCGMVPPNIWLGVSVENQATADERIPELLSIPAAVRFVSYEPALEPVKLCQLEQLDWVIVGGESGPGRRDCGVTAIIDVARQAQAASVPVFVKQDCYRWPGQQGRIPDDVWKLKQHPAAAKITAMVMS